MLGAVLQTRVSGGNRIHDPHANSLAHYPLDYQGTHVENVTNAPIVEAFRHKVCNTEIFLKWKSTEKVLKKGK